MNEILKLPICPMCGGNLRYWREYIVTKTQSISKKGVLSRTVKTSPIEPLGSEDLEGFECKKCGWVLNTVNEIENCDKYDYLMKWFDLHKDELKV